MQSFSRFFLAFALCAVVGLSALSSTGCTRKNPGQIMRLYAEAPPGAIGVNNPIRTIRMPITGNEYNIYSKPIAFEGDIIDINLYRVELGYCIGMDISRKAALRLTMINPGWRVFLLVNDQAVGVRQFDTTSFEGRLYMFLEIPDDEMAAYVEKLRESCMLVQELKKSQQ